MKRALALGFLLTACHAHPRHHDFVTNEATGVVTILDLDTNEILGNVALGRKPRELRLAKDGRHLLVTLAGPVVQPLEAPPIHADSPIIVAPPPNTEGDGIAIVDIERRVVERIDPNPSRGVAMVMP